MDGSNSIEFMNIKAIYNDVRKNEIYMYMLHQVGVILDYFIVSLI